MARYNEILAGRFNRLVQKLLSMKGPASLVSVDDSMTIAIPLFHGAENRYLEGWERFAILLDQAAVVGAASALRLRNPAGSNVVAVFEKIVLINIAGVVQNPVLQEGTIATDLATTQNGQRLDPRGRSTPSLVASKGSGATGLTALDQIPQGTVLGSFDVIATDIQEIPLLPGEAYQLVSDTNNVRLTAAFWWRERPLEASEIT